MTTRTRGAVGIGWLLVLALVVAVLMSVGDAATSIALYLLVWLTWTIVPGVLVWRALARPTTLVQEIGFGSVLGIALLILVWLPATLLHQPAVMWLWPLGVLVAFTAIPSLRRHWWPRRTPERHTPGRWQAAMMVVCGVAVVRLYVLALHLWPLPPKASSTIFQDVWYELSLTQALRHSVVIDDPSVAGVPLHYHWFSNADVAATQLLSGVSAPEVLLHLWLVPMLLTLLFAVAATTERLLQGPDGADAPAVPWWAGPLAALLAGALPAALFLGEPRLPAINSGFVHSSTSGILALVVVLALVGPVLDILHGIAGRGTWVLLLILLALGAGTKPSLLPVIACGGLLAVLAQWIRTRRFPVVPAVLAFIPLVLIPIAAIAVIGSTGGSRLQLFQTLALDRSLNEAAGIRVDLPGHGGWLAPALVDGSRHVWATGLGLLAMYVLTELPRLVGLASPLTRVLRSDPGTWWCTGVVGSGFCGLWVLAHPGYSQHYFWRIVIPLGIVLTVTMVVRLLPDPHRSALPAIGLISLAGVATAVVFIGTDPALVGAAPVRHVAYKVSDRLVPYAAAVAILVATIVVLTVVSRFFGWARVPAVALVACFICAAGATAAAHDINRAAQEIRSHREAAADPARHLSRDEQQAALWLNRHSADDDVVATNVFCIPTGYSPHCRHSAFWVSALTGRQLFIGAWGYTEKNLQAYGRGGDMPYQRLPSPWPGRVALSLDAVRSPSTSVMAALKRQGVKWIFADLRATEVSPRLEEYATPRYRNDDVMIYRLHD